MSQRGQSLMSVAMAASVDEVAGEAGEDDDHDGMDAGEVDNAKRCDADDDGNHALGEVVAEVLAVHQQQCCRGNEADDNGAQTTESGLNGRTVVMTPDPMTGEEHEQEWRKHDGECGDNRAPHTASDDVADVGGAVDADGARGHL